MTDYVPYLLLKQSLNNNISIISCNFLPFILYDGQLQTSFGFFRYGMKVMFVNNWRHFLCLMWAVSAHEQDRIFQHH